MQLIIPMTGEGSRFTLAGFERQKPFIHIHKKPLLSWVLRIFPQIDPKNIILIFRRDHFESDKHSYIKEDLRDFASQAKIFLVDEYDKRGPLPNILKANSVIDNTLPTFVSYCDFYLHWNFNQYLNDLINLGPDGSMPCYTGFHPHLLHAENLYACAKVDKENNLVEVKEKFSFTSDNTKSLHSPGIYYYKTGALLKHYYQLALTQNLSTNSEFFCSLPFNLMLKDGLKIYAPANVERFCQWGTPRDLAEYLYWIDFVKRQDNNTLAASSKKLPEKTHKQIFSYWSNFLSLEKNLD